MDRGADDAAAGRWQARIFGGRLAGNDQNQPRMTSKSVSQNPVEACVRQSQCIAMQINRQVRGFLPARKAAVPGAVHRITCRFDSRSFCYLACLGLLGWSLCDCCFGQPGSVLRRWFGRISLGKRLWLGPYCQRFYRSRNPCPELTLFSAEATGRHLRAQSYLSAGGAKPCPVPPCLRPAVRPPRRHPKRCQNGWSP